MSKSKSAQYTLEFKIEAVRLVCVGPERRGSVAGAGRTCSDAA